jgi:Putative transposase
MGPRAGQKVLSLQSLPSRTMPSTPELRVNAHGFSLYAALRWRADQRKELEQFCRYIARPAIANERLKRNHAGQVVLQLKSPYKDATTQTFHAFLDRFLTAPPATTVAFSSSRKRN